MASIEDAAEYGERADALVSGLLGRVMRQRRTVAAALDYIGRCRGRRGRTAGNWLLPQVMRVRTGCRPCSAGAGGRGRSPADALPGLAQDVLPDDPGDLIGPGLAFDETAHLKKGKSTACASPQHAGVTGKVENCVTWVFAALVTALGQAWADFDVYMPDCWAKDAARRAKAGIPEDLAFATKPELAIAQAKRLMEAGLRVLWAAADEVYGRSGEFRAALRALSLAYVVIIPCDYRVTLAKAGSPR